MQRPEQLPPLPPEYTTAWGKYYPLRVGGWARPAWWQRPDNEYDPEPNPFAKHYLWQITEAKPGHYVAVSRDGQHRVKLKPEHRWRLLPILDTLSERLRLEDYPEHCRRFQQAGIGAYFYEAERGRICLKLEKPRVKWGGTLLAVWIGELKSNPVLMGQWLDQILWAVAHPRKAYALRWLGSQGEYPFGQWPNLRLPKELDQIGTAALPLYRDYQAWCKANPPTQEEIDAVAMRVYDHMDEQYQNRQLAEEIRSGQHDEYLISDIYQLIGEAGIRPPEV